MELVELLPAVAPLEEEGALECPPALDPWELSPVVLAVPVLDSSPGVVFAEVPQWMSDPAQTERTQAAALVRAPARDAIRNLSGRRGMATRLALARAAARGTMRSVPERRNMATHRRRLP